MPTITLRHPTAPTRQVTTPPPGAPHAIATGACPRCDVTPFRVRGGGMHPSADDRAYEAHACCVNCGAHVGTLRAEMATIFGVREDAAVLEGRPRVY